VTEAEKLKQRHGCAFAELLTPGEMIEMPRVGERELAPLPRRRLCELIEPRVQEIFTLIKEQLDSVGVLGKLASGVVITGGSAIMEGMTEQAERVFRLPVRRGSPRHIGGLVDAVNSPMYATGVGLVLCEVQHLQLNGLARPRNVHGWQRMRERVVEWIRDFF
jgi:cell division protein FtsA